nr:AMMECR1 domain-containing protein [Candidatus Nitrosotenuis chungbukensis]
MPRRLNNALVDAAIAAATEDPRFSPVTKNEA